MKTHTRNMLIMAVLAVSAVLTFCPEAARTAALRPDSFDASFLWRAFTCHLVHWSPKHLFYDGLCFAILASLLPTWKTWTCLALSARIVAVAVTLAYPQMTAYGGLSGVNCALFTLWALSLMKYSKPLALIALTIIIGKTVLEIHAGHTFFAGDAFLPADMAHVAGIISGIICHICEKRLLKMIDIAINYSKFPRRRNLALSFTRSLREHIQ